MAKLEAGSTKDVVKRNMRVLIAKGMLADRAKGIAIQAAAFTKVRRSRKGGAVAQAIGRVGVGK